MTMYLPDPGTRSTGSEPGEFIDVPAMAHGVPGETRTARPEHLHHYDGGQ
jgi:hypothetical protein